MKRYVVLGVLDDNDNYEDRQYEDGDESCQKSLIFMRDFFISGKKLFGIFVILIYLKLST